MFRDKQKHSGRLFAIGDIHGCPDELAAIVKTIAPREDDTVVFVGDYVDRGPSARDAVEVVLDLQKGPAEVVTLKGNHEDMMLSYLGFGGHYGESFPLQWRRGDVGQLRHRREPSSTTRSNTFPMSI